MKLNGDEKRIQLLFREIRRNEGQRVPEFAGLLGAANSRNARSTNPTRWLRLAIAVAMLFAALLITAAIFERPSRPQGGAAPEQASAPAPKKVDPGSIGSSSPEAEVADAIVPRKFARKRIRHRRTSDKTAIAIRSLFAWRSPTGSLLRTPDDELLNALPRLGESLRTIKTYSPDQFN